MKLYKLGGLVAVLACLGILVFSYLSWQDKLQGAGTPEQTASTETENTDSETQTTQTESTSDDSVNTELLANMDERVQELFLQKTSEDETLQLLIAGSEALESGNPGYAQRLKTSLEESYGDSIEVTIEAVSGTSDSLKYVDLTAGYDLALLEPLTLMNNDRVSIEDERQDVQDFSARLEQANPEALVILHAPQPIYGAGYYLAQVQALEEFASLYDYPYIEHWDAWPDTDDIALKEHLTEDAVPNDKGAETWATELTTYFISN
ncbi:SGNH/GDSL hydrolase family protein [Planococcus sp. CP5-4]|uniref:SGNH/GDSL hydrolase family protein n=1 Tax=unclassified Planococcus (in: firmicutes) TaxID=2662419 RepID=UPI001C21D856|nr:MULTISPECIES: SGNH/GDSL hydrolase family protein [unclassified Planococcus (in: firmicutes)]MBU9675105.1 SGNH/GDSL hydrolase family protein [Planococcus sp. CP5-4_YE]MBV0908064.1 SGNH/GDSL hydrolase family protein [Planococcus sp. CP5-4_UN]MBW6062125.1 SGNH/GDSL hydrolase family protein [Planococcus sp. CP5-4]